jgi:hypothetical protein
MVMFVCFLFDGLCGCFIGDNWRFKGSVIRKHFVKIAIQYGTRKQVQSNQSEHLRLHWGSASLVILLYPLAALSF